MLTPEELLLELNSPVGDQRYPSTVTDVMPDSSAPKE